MASTMAVPKVVAQQPAEAPSTPAQSSRDQRFRTLQLTLFTTGALLMPLGIFAIFLGWYGVAHTKYQYDQLPYVVSGGLLGLGLVFLGGFLYFGAWLARIGNEQRDSTRQLTDAVLELVELVGRQGGSPVLAGGGGAIEAPADELVLAGGGSTIHRRDCALIAHRDDLRPVPGDRTGFGTCRVCRPHLD